MAAIGQLQATRDGGWAGPIFILAHEVKIKLAPNDNQANPKAPAFRVFAGSAELGAVWQHKTKDDEPREYLSGDIDFPGLSDPLSLAFFFSEDGKRVQAVWNRRDS